MKARIFIPFKDYQIFPWGLLPEVDIKITRFRWSVILWLPFLRAYVNVKRITTKEALREKKAKAFAKCVGCSLSTAYFVMDRREMYATAFGGETDWTKFYD